jgi:acetyl-CoA carboxylase, biotin carboxylase subunit
VGVPTVPGSEGLLMDEAEAYGMPAKIGYPVMIKATAGAAGGACAWCKPKPT